MAVSQKISELPVLVTADAADLLAVVDVTDGVTKQVTVGSSAVYNEGDTGAVDRTVEARLKDIRSVVGYNPAADGVTDDTTALNNAFAAAQNKILIFPERKTFAFTGQLTIPANSKIDFNGCTLLTSGSDTSSTSQILVGVGSSIQALIVNTPTGETIRRVINFADDCNAFDVQITSVDQQNNRTSTEDAALNVDGDNCSLIKTRVTNYDNAIRIENNNEITMNDTVVVSYVRGMNIDTCDSVHISGYRAHTRSANGLPSPGHNGLLLEEVRFSDFSDIHIANAGEHAFRIGGSTTNGSRNLTFSNLVAVKPGQSGFKILDATNRTVAVNISGLQVSDCSNGAASSSNEDGLRLEQCDDVTVTGFQVVRIDNGSTSCFDGIFINDCTGIKIPAPYIEFSTNHGIEMVDTDGVINGIYIDHPKIIVPGDDGINISSPTQILRDIIITDMYVRGQTGFGIDLAAGGGVSQPIVLTGIVGNEGSGMITKNSTDPQILIDLLPTSQPETATGTFTLNQFGTTNIDSSAGVVTGTLGSAFKVGETKVIVMTNASNSSTVSVTNHETSDPEVFTFAQVDDTLVLMWTGTEWITVANSGVAI